MFYITFKGGFKAQISGQTSAITDFIRKNEILFSDTHCPYCKEESCSCFPYQVAIKNVTILVTDIIGLACIMNDFDTIKDQQKSFLPIHIKYAEEHGNFRISQYIRQLNTFSK